MKEYNDFGKLIFEGEYLNGEENGKGKEYNEINGKIEFEGEYLKGKKWEGKIIKYFDNGEKNFEGNYINGSINGIVREWDKNGKCIFDGEYLNGKKWNSKLNIIKNDSNKICNE